MVHKYQNQTNNFSTEDLKVLTILKELEKLLENRKKRNISSDFLVNWADKQYYYLTEGDGENNNSNLAQLLRDILYDISAQWECLQANNYNEYGEVLFTLDQFPDDLINHWFKILSSTVSKSNLVL